MLIDDPVSKYWPDAKGSAIGPVQLASLLTIEATLNIYGINNLFTENWCEMPDK